MTIYLKPPNVGGLTILTEVKTIVKEDFKELVAPLGEHRQRTNLYMRLVGESEDSRAGHINTTEASILYICKGFGCKDDSIKEKGITDAPFSPFKEYTIRRDDSETDDIVELARQVMDFRNGGDMPPRQCSISSCAMAKGCPVQKECWHVKPK